MLGDIIYLDTQRAESLASQLLGGLPTQESDTIENIKARGFEASASIAGIAIGGKAGHDASAAHSTTRVPHHHFLVSLEEVLQEKGLLSVIGETDSIDIKLDDYRRALLSKPFVKALGWPSFEFYSALPKYASDTNAVNRFVKSSALASNEDYKGLIMKLNAARNALKQEYAREKKARMEKQLNDFELALANLLSSDVVAPEFVEALTSFRDILLPDLFCMRLFVDEEDNTKQILCRLKQQCLVAYDTYEQLLYDYGVFPDVQLTVLGLVTAAPAADLDYSKDFRMPTEDDMENKADENNLKPMEAAMRNLFPIWAPIGQFGRFMSYPRIMLSPIAIYRSAN